MTITLFFFNFKNKNIQLILQTFRDCTTRIHLQARNSSISRGTLHELDGAGRALPRAVQFKRQGRTDLRFQRQCLQVNLRNETSHVRV